MDNKFLVGAQGDRIVVGLALRAARMTKEDALNLAAWLVTMSTTDVENDFLPLVKEIQNG